MKQKIISITFVVFIIGLSLLSFILKDNELSKFERRKLAQIPKLNKNFIENLDNYIDVKEQYEKAYIIRKEKIDKLYNEIKKIKKIKI